MTKIDAPEGTVSESGAVEEFASIEDLLGKPPATETIEVLFPNPDGEPIPRKLRFRALPSEDYDLIQAKFPPTEKQRKKGQNVDWDKFAPALIAACMDKPQMSYEQVKKLFDSNTWSSGELGNLFSVANALCISGFDVPKYESG